MKTDGKNDVRNAETGEDRLNWRYQDKEYNENFKKWRRKKQDSVGFYFVDKPDRLTYQDGLGFINDYPEAHEAKAFRKALMMLGLILLYRVAVDILFRYVLPPIMESMGLNIHHSLFSGQYSGSSTIMIGLDISAQLLGRLIPTAILVKHLEIPFSVMMPTHVTNKKMFGFAVPAAMLTAGVCAVMSSFYDGVLSAVGIDTSRASMIPNGTSGIIYAVLVQILIIPIVSELCTHGVIMQLIRQFGDGTALCFTSIIIASATYDVTKFPFAAAAAFVSGYFIIRTGSVITGIIMRITTCAYAYALSFLKYHADPSYNLVIIKSFVFLTIMIGLVAAIKFLYSHGDRFAMTIKPGYMSFGRKLLEIATSIPTIIWLTLTFLMTVLNIKFKL